MRILVTGGTGFIGRHFIHRFSDQYSFTVLTRDSARAQRLLGDKVRCIESLPLTNTNASEDEAENTEAENTTFDAIINLAGEPIADKRWTDAQKQRICHSRWHITEQVVNFIEHSKVPPKVFISGSAIGYYGRQKDQLVDENYQDIHHEFSHEICAKWEQIAQRAQTPQTRTCIMRTGVVLADGEGALGKMHIPFSLGLGGKVGSGKQYMSWIHIDDMTAAIDYLLNQPQCQGIYNFTAPNPVTNSEFTQALGQAMRRPTILPMPPFALRLMMGEAADLLLTGQRVIPQKLLDDGFTFAFQEIQPALRAIYSS